MGLIDFEEKLDTNGINNFNTVPHLSVAQLKTQKSENATFKMVVWESNLSWKFVDSFTDLC